MKVPSHISVPPKDFKPRLPGEAKDTGAGKGDMRGRPITVLSDQGRENWDAIFGKKPIAK